VRQVNDSDDIIIGTAYAKAIRFHAPDVRSMGRAARGVRGITLAADDYVVDMEIVEERAALLTLTENGYGKRTEFDEYRVTRRGGKGIITIIPSLRNGLGIAIKTVYEDDELLVTSQNGNVIRIPVHTIRMQGRNTQGVRIMRLDDGDRAVAVARIGGCDWRGYCGRLRIGDLAGLYFSPLRGKPSFFCTSVSWSPLTTPFAPSRYIRGTRNTRTGSVGFK